jgi:hypothetical protein
VRPIFSERRGRAQALDIAGRIERLARTHAEAGRTPQAQDLFDIAEEWYGRARRPEKQAEMLAESAASWAAQGDRSDSGILQQHCYSTALKLYFTVPSAYRTPHRVEEAIDGLRTKLAAAGRQALGEMRTITAPPIDLSDFADEAVKLVQGLEPLDALLTFCEMHPLPSRAEHYEQAEQLVAGSLLGQLFGGTTLAADGRAVARRDAASSGAAAQAAQIAAEAMKSCLQTTALITAGMVLPALDVMQLECHFTPLDFYEIVRRSPLVPRERQDLVAKGLYAGYCRDFVQALHLLVPQFEHMVRVALKDAGAHTTTHEDGIDMEIGLSALIEKPQMLEVFGEDLTFTIRVLMCSQEGPNFRNAIAHGLADSALCQSPYGVFVWWLLLRLVTQGFVLALRAEMQTSDTNASTA